MNQINATPLSFSEFSIPEEEWFSSRSLGKGDQAEVFHVKNFKGEEFYLKKFFTQDKNSFYPFAEDGTPYSAILEWEAAQQLKHPNLICYYEFTRGPHTTILQEYVDGSILVDRSFNEKATLHLLEQLADALSYAFEQGWVHLDLDSTNIMIDQREELKLIDLGSFSCLQDAEEFTVAEFQQRLFQEFSWLILDRGIVSAERKENIQALLKKNIFSFEVEGPVTPAAGPRFAAALKELAAQLKAAANVLSK